MLSVTCGWGRQRDVQVISFTSLGLELKPLDDNLVWFYLVRLPATCLTVVL